MSTIRYFYIQNRIMIKELRAEFNQNFTEEKYQNYLAAHATLSPGDLDFRIAETPIFLSKAFATKMLDACDQIIDVITAPNFKDLTERSIPTHLKIPNEENNPEFLVFDFGICKNKAGDLEPQLIEMQGFPTLFAYQYHQSKIGAAYCNLPPKFSSYFNDTTPETYLAQLKALILGRHEPENVILLEVYPELQKTRIDFKCTENLVGIKSVCITKLIADGNKLYYMNEGVKTPVHRIYNRLIFDDLEKQENLPPIVDLTQPYEVEWAPHPNWFYRISKFTLPFIQHEYVPQTQFLSDIKDIPKDLEDYVLKPLFSFAGMGVVIDVTKEDIEAVKDPENWILQKKVQYADIIETLDEPAKAEVRLFYFWPNDEKRPKAVHNLARLSKGKMIGTRYNKDKTWVGGTIAFLEK